MFEKNLTYEYIMNENEEREYLAQNSFVGLSLDGSFLPCPTLRILDNIKKHFQWSYYISQKSLDFGWKKFGSEVLSSSFQAAALCTVTFGVCSGLNIQHVNGYTYDFWMMSFTVYASLIFISNVTLLVRTEHISVFLLFWIIGFSILPYLILNYVFDTQLDVENGSQYLINKMSETSHYYLVLSANIMIAFMIEMWRRLRQVFWKPRINDYFKTLLKEGKAGEDKYFTEDILKSFVQVQEPIKKKSSNIKDKRFSLDLSLDSEKAERRGEEDSALPDVKVFPRYAGSNVEVHHRDNHLMTSKSRFQFVEESENDDPQAPQELEAKNEVAPDPENAEKENLSVHVNNSSVQTPFSGTHVQIPVTGKGGVLGKAKEL